MLSSFDDSSSDVESSDEDEQVEDESEEDEHILFRRVQFSLICRILRSPLPGTLGSEYT